MHEIVFTFIFVFFAALPGRTTFMLIFLAASMDTWRILLGSIPAFVIQCALAVVAGRALSKLPRAYIQWAAGVLFLYFARKFWREARQQNPAGCAGQSTASAFLLFLMAELGDVSQLAIAARASQAESSLNVFLGAAAAMSAVAGVAVFAGRALTAVVNSASLQRAAAIVFFAMGCYIIIRIYL